MPKKGGKKGGGGKLAAMTEEERLLFAQQKAVAEEEMSKRKEDMLTQFLKDKLRKEEHNSVVNQHKLTERWRAVFRQTRAQDLRKDIEILSQTFERVLDRKDSVIKCLLGDLTESKQQSDLVLRSYLQNVDLLLDLQGSRLAFHNQDMKTKLDELKAEFNTEREQIMALHKQDCIYLEDVRIGLDQRYAALDNEAQREYQSNRDDIKNRSIEDRNALRVQREGEVEEMWRQLQEATRSYRESTEEHRVACEALRERDERSSREIETQMKRLQKIQESCAALRARMSTMQREGEAAARDLRAVKEKATDRRLELKKQMSSIHAQQRSALSRLTVLSDNANKKLRSVISKGERLIKLAGVCRKLETERERVQPFHSCSLSAEEQQLVNENQLEPAVTELAQAMHDYAGLEGMWQRWAKVELDRLCLQREKAALSQENLRLRTLLRQYLDGLSVSDAALRQDRTLLNVSRSVHNQRQGHTLLNVSRSVHNQRQSQRQSQRHNQRQSQRQRPARQQQAAHVLQHTL